LTIVAVLVATLALTGVAQARGNGLLPPGNSGATQYLETIPTAGGGRPTDTLHVTQHHSGSGSATGGGSAGGSTGGSTSGAAGGAAAPLAPVALSTRHALKPYHKAGLETYRFAEATAPASVRGLPVGSGPAPYPTSQQSGGAGPSVGTQVLDSFTASSAQGGLGWLLPVLLVAMAIAAVGSVVVRTQARGR
jgi:hypothetical protein